MPLTHVLTGADNVCTIAMLKALLYAWARWSVVFNIEQMMHPVSIGILAPTFSSRLRRVSLHHSGMRVEGFPRIRKRRSFWMLNARARFVGCPLAGSSKNPTVSGGWHGSPWIKEKERKQSQKTRIESGHSSPSGESTDAAARLDARPTCGRHCFVLFFVIKHHLSSRDEFLIVLPRILRINETPSNRLRRPQLFICKFYIINTKEGHVKRSSSTATLLDSKIFPNIL